MCWVTVFAPLDCFAQQVMPLLGSSRCPGICFVNSAYGTISASGNTVATTTAFRVLPGNALACAVRWSGAYAITSIVNSTSSDSFASVPRVTDGSSKNIQDWYAFSVSGKASETITVTFSSASASAKSILCKQIAGVSALDAGATSSGYNAASATTISTGSFSIANANSIVLMSGHNATAAVSYSVGNIAGAPAQAIVCSGASCGSSDVPYMATEYTIRSSTFSSQTATINQSPTQTLRLWSEITLH